MLLFFFVQLGVGSFFLRYVPQLLRSILNEIGIGEDMYNPVCKFLLLVLLVDLLFGMLGFVHSCCSILGTF